VLNHEENMITQKQYVWEATDLNDYEIVNAIDELLNALGEGRIDSVAYDTAWIARLNERFPGQGFGQALDWLRKNQHPDGSWGGTFLHYHDRIICTLSAIIALRICDQGSDGDWDRIRRGEAFIWQNFGRLHFDAHDTIGFPVLAVALVHEAHELGLDIPDSISHDAATIEKKLNLLGSDPKRWQYTSMSFSLEAVPPFLPDPSAFESADFLLANGSVGTSPAATAAYVLYAESPHERSLDFLRRAVALQGDGGATFVEPIESFEMAWALHQLRLAESISPDHPVIRRHLDRLWELWSSESGLSSSEFFPATDLDDTATGFSLLHWGGYPVDLSVFEFYEGDHYFHCYPGEADLSLSVNIRTLAALKRVRSDSRVDRWIEKISSMLRRYALDHGLWFDKWHISPYYLTHSAVFSLHGVLDDLLPPHIRWIVKTQQADGGWGYYYHSTYEETALCLDTLLFWDRHVERIDPDIIHRAAAYLKRGMYTTDLPALYIGKALYMPLHVVRATILGALYSYAEYTGR
jgi:halimadienyl-diphosphate synthase